MNDRYEYFSIILIGITLKYVRFCYRQICVRSQKQHETNVAVNASIRQSKKTMCHEISDRGLCRQKACQKVDSRCCRKVSFALCVFWGSFVPLLYNLPLRGSNSACAQLESSGTRLPLERSPSINSRSQSSEQLKVAWLMSYPNSGTSYTHRLVRQASNRTTATNYGAEHLYKGGNNILPNTKWTSGPFRTNDTLALPPNYIFTKTHCGGRCTHCGPNKYIETPRSFQRECLRTKRYVNYTQIHGHYPPSFVSKAVHLIRNPMDNVVSRFHNDHSARLNNSRYQKRFPLNEKGFQQWCKDVDVKYAADEQHNRFLDERVLHAFRTVPCHGEFFRFAQWHNLATQTAQSMQIPLHVVYYEDYDSEWEETLSGLLDFLELDSVLPKATQPFVIHEYAETYYTKEQRVAIRKLVKEISTVEIWNLLGRYFRSER